MWSVDAGTRALIAGLIVCLAACDRSTSPSPVVIDPNAPIAGAHNGAVTITYAGASVAPGSQVTGCGSSIAGCAGKLRLSFTLRSGAAGAVLFTAATLHGVNKIACLSATGPAFPMAANATVPLELVFDQFNASCALPFEVTTMAVTVEGTVEVASRQEFDIRYRFTP